jgi:exoribonuclease II
MHKGKIIEFIEQGRFISTLCLEDRGNKLHLLTSTNREVNLSPKRALLVSSSAMDPLRPREELLEKLRQTESIRETLKERINVPELWALVRDEHERFNHRYLAQLCFGESISDDHLSALIRAVFEDHVYFKLKDGQFLPNSEDKVDQIRREEEEAATRKMMLKAGGAWLKAVREQKSAAPPPPACEKVIIDCLTNLVLYGREASDYKFSKELLASAGMTNIRQARSLLVKLGVWDQDENLELIRLEIKTTFGKDNLALSTQVACSKPDLEGREDLRDLPLLTIDGPWTKDFDDAVSLEQDGDQLVLGVHIADVAASIPQDSLLDREACLRGSSLYLPRQQIPMIPPDLSQETLSLKQDCDRLAVSLLARLEKDGRIIDYRFAPSIVRVKRQLTYDESNHMLASDSTLRKLRQLSMTLKGIRMGNDAISLSLPEIEVQFRNNGALHLEMVEQNTPSRMLVAELMIFYNWLLATFCKRHEIPVLFRTQEEPSERLTEDQFGYIYYVFKQRRKLNPLKLSTEPAPHAGLGLDVYSNATSPIRRYLDLVAQRQLISFLSAKTLPYDEETLEKLRMAIEPTLKVLERVRRNRNRYWILKYLRQHVGEKYRAMVLDVLKSRYRVLLLDYLHMGELRQEGEAGMYPGQQFNVVIKKADPWDDILEMSYAGD